jgi:hypothetical protein
MELAMVETEIISKKDYETSRKDTKFLRLMEKE